MNIASYINEIDHKSRMCSMNIEYVIFWGRIYSTTPIKQLHHKISRWKVSTCTGLNDIHPGDGQPRTRQRGLPRQHLPLPLRHLPPGRVAEQLWVRQVAPCNEMEQDDLRRRRGVPKPRDQYEHQDTYRTLAGFSYPIPPPPPLRPPKFRTAPTRKNHQNQPEREPPNAPSWANINIAQAGALL